MFKQESALKTGSCMRPHITTAFLINLFQVKNTGFRLEIAFKLGRLED